MMVVLLVFGGVLLIFAQSSAIAPVIYTLFTVGLNAALSKGTATA